MVPTVERREAKLRIRLLATPAAIVVLAVVGCSSRYAGQESYAGSAVFTDVALASGVVAAGEPALLRVVVHNRSDDDLTLDYKGFHIFGYRLRNAADDRILAWFPWQNKVQPQQVVVAARDSIYEEFRVPTRRQPEGWNFEGNLLAAGTYRIEAGLAEYADAYPWETAVLQVRDFDP
jgi:hypothetical protein